MSGSSAGNEEQRAVAREAVHTPSILRLGVVVDGGGESIAERIKASCLPTTECLTPDFCYSFLDPMIEGT